MNTFIQKRHVLKLNHSTIFNGQRLHVATESLQILFHHPNKPDKHKNRHASNWAFVTEGSLPAGQLITTRRDTCLKTDIQISLRNPARWIYTIKIPAYLLQCKTLTRITQAGARRRSRINREVYSWGLYWSGSHLKLNAIKINKNNFKKNEPGEGVSYAGKYSKLDLALNGQDMP